METEQYSSRPEAGEAYASMSPDPFAHMETGSVRNRPFLRQGTREGACLRAKIRFRKKKKAGAKARHRGFSVFNVRHPPVFPTLSFKRDTFPAGF
jgi:hypothetical protein